MIYLQLFYEFCKAGILAIGGGLTILPFLNHMADHYPWFSRTELANIIAVAQAAPGPIGTNLAAYAGYAAAGIWGAVTATVALTVPSVAAGALVIKFIAGFKKSPLVQSIFWGLRPAAAGLIAAAGWGVFSMSVLSLDSGGTLTGVQWSSAALFAATALLYMNFKGHPIIYIIFAAAAGIVFKL